MKPQPLVGILAPNNFLENPEKILDGKLPHPEHLMTRDGAIFTSLGNGEVVKIVGEKITVLGKCGTSSEFKRRLLLITTKIMLILQMVMSNSFTIVLQGWHLIPLARNI